MSTTPPISGLVPMIHVTDVERSADFYRLFGFEIGNRVPPGPMGWCWLYQPHADNWRRGANLMLARAECPIDGKSQQALFYLYAADLVALRNSLMRQGLKPGEICYPEYLPKGEFGLQDPDGYHLMIAQSVNDTP